MVYSRAPSTLPALHELTHSLTCHILSPNLRNFQTLPTTWMTSCTLDVVDTYDVVIHMGLGVYDCDDKLLVEKGAYNGRNGTSNLLPHTQCAQPHFG